MSVTDVTQRGLSFLWYLTVLILGSPKTIKILQIETLNLYLQPVFSCKKEM